MKEILSQLLAACVATAAFSFVYELPVKYVAAATGIGTVSWLFYWLLEPHIGYGAAVFVTSVMITTLSRIASPYFRTPLTAFLLPALFLLVPGKDIFYAAYYLIRQELHAAAGSAAHAVVVSGAIVFGIAFVYLIPQKWFNHFKRTGKRPGSEGK